MGTVCQESFLGFIPVHIPTSSKHNPKTDPQDTSVRWSKAKSTSRDHGRGKRKAEYPGEARSREAAW